MVRLPKKTDYPECVGKMLEVSKDDTETLQDQENSQVTEFKGIEIHVKNLNADVTEETIRELFGLYGTLLNVEIKKVSNSKTRRYAIISYSSPGSASNAIEQLNGSMMLNNQIYVVLAHARAKERRKSSTCMRKLSLGRIWSGPEKMLPQRNYQQCKISSNECVNNRDSDFLFLIKDSTKRAIVL